MKARIVPKSPFILFLFLESRGDFHKVSGCKLSSICRSNCSRDKAIDSGRQTACLTVLSLLGWCNVLSSQKEEGGGGTKSREVIPTTYYIGGELRLFMMQAILNICAIYNEVG